MIGLFFVSHPNGYLCQVVRTTLMLAIAWSIVLNSLTIIAVVTFAVVVVLVAAGR